MYIFSFLVYKTLRTIVTLFTLFLPSYIYHKSLIFYILSTCFPVSL